MLLFERGDVLVRDQHKGDRGRLCLIVIGGHMHYINVLELKLLGNLPQKVGALCFQGIKIPEDLVGLNEPRIPPPAHIKLGIEHSSRIADARGH